MPINPYELDPQVAATNPQQARANVMRRQAEMEARKLRLQEETERRQQQAATRAEEAERRKAAAEAQTLPLETATKQATLDEAKRKATAQTAAADADAWTNRPDLPQYKVPFHQAPPEAGRHFVDAYGVEGREAAAQKWNETVNRINPPTPPEGMEEEQTISPKGEVTRRYSKPPARSTTGEITESDVAKAGGDPNSIPKKEWASFVASASRGKEGKMTEMQSNALQYSARLEFNNRILDKLEKEKFDPASVGTGMQKWAPNLMRGPEFQQYTAAKNNWISAVLRKESGAAISQPEYQNADREYFPQIGDGPEVLAQKSELRRIAEHNMRVVAGGAASKAESSSPTPQQSPTAPQTTSAPPTPSQPAPAAPPQQPVQVNTPEEAAALPPGTVFLTPDGRRKIR